MCSLFSYEKRYVSKNGKNILHFAAQSATSEKVVTISEAGSEVDDELIRLQQSKRDEISTITSQLQVKKPFFRLWVWRIEMGGLWLEFISGYLSNF